MKRKRFTEEQIACALRQAESGKTVTDICREIGVSENTFYRWRRKYEGMGIAELRRLKQLVADLTLDKHMLKEVLKRISEANSNARACQVSDRGL